MNILNKLYNKIIVKSILEGFDGIFFSLIFFHFLAFLFLLIGSFQMERLVFAKFWIYSIPCIIFYIIYFTFSIRYINKSEKYIKQLSSEIDLNILGLKEADEVFESCLINQNIDNIMDNISTFESKYKKINLLYKLFNKREDYLEIIKNEKLIDYINQLENEEEKYDILYKVISKINEDNLTEYYDIINSLFKEDTNIPKINSIKYKMIILQEKELKEKSVIIHI